MISLEKLANRYMIKHNIPNDYDLKLKLEYLQKYNRIGY